MEATGLSRLVDRYWGVKYAATSMFYNLKFNYRRLVTTDAFE
jgi:hypothetical protein